MCVYVRGGMCVFGGGGGKSEGERKKGGLR